MSQELESLLDSHRETVAKHKGKMAELAMQHLAKGDGQADSIFFKYSYDFIEKAEEFLAQFAIALDNAKAKSNSNRLELRNCEQYLREERAKNVKIQADLDESLTLSRSILGELFLEEWSGDLPEDVPEASSTPKKS